jgi:hypothetical protein
VVASVVTSTGGAKLGTTNPEPPPVPENKEQ